MTKIILTTENIYKQCWGSVDCHQSGYASALTKELTTVFDCLTSDLDKVLSGYTLITGEILSDFRPIDIPYDVEIPAYSGSKYPRYRDGAIAAAKSLILECLGNPEPDNGRFVANMIEVIAKLNKNALKGLWEQAYSYWPKSANESYESVAMFESLVIIAHEVIEAKFKEEIRIEHVDTLAEYAVRQGDTANTCRSQFNQMGYSELLSEAFGLKIHYTRKDGNNEAVKSVFAEATEAFSSLIADERERGGHYLELAIMHSDIAMAYAKEAGNLTELAKLKQDKDKMERKLNDYRISGQDPHTYLYSKSYEIPIVHPEQFGITGFHDIVEALYQSLIKEITRDKIQERIKNNQLSNIFDKRVSNEDGVTVFSAFDPVENCSTCDTATICKTTGHKCFKSRETINMSDMLDVWAATCYGVIQALTEIDDIEESIDLAMSDKSPNPDRVFTVQLGIEQWLQNQYYTALRLLCPEFEYLLREHIRKCGGITSDTSVRVDKVNTLRGFLQKNKDIDWAPQDVKWLIEVLLTAEPLNLRNKTSHGLSVQSDAAISALVVILLRYITTGNFNSTLERTGK